MCRSTTVVDLRTVARLYRDVHVRVPTTTVFLFVDLLSGVLVTAFAPHFELNLEKKYNMAPPMDLEAMVACRLGNNGSRRELCCHQSHQALREERTARVRLRQ